jgi:hypothetical protein
MEESKVWLNLLNDQLPEVQVEKDNHEIATICSRARTLLKQTNGDTLPIDNILEILEELHHLDKAVTSWRKGPNWSFRTIDGSDLLDTQNSGVIAGFPMKIQLHKDIWIAYEWNYHRTARLIMHEHLLQCIGRVAHTCRQNTNTQTRLESLQQKSRNTIQAMASDILSTVPQSFGDIDQDGNILDDGVSPRTSGIGAYFLLWPIKIVKRSQTVTPEQQKTAETVFERIRERTGMKATLGDLSCI